MSHQDAQGPEQGAYPHGPLAPFAEIQHVRRGRDRRLRTPPGPRVAVAHLGAGYRLFQEPGNGVEASAALGAFHLAAPLLELLGVDGKYSAAVAATGGQGHGSGGSGEQIWILSPNSRIRRGAVSTGRY